MIQAEGEEKGNGGWRKSYKGIWSEGHWVIAIGYDRDGMFFEDPLPPCRPRLPEICGVGRTLA